MRKGTSKRARNGASAGNIAAPVLTIAEISRNYGVTRRALRFYESRGLLTSGRMGASRTRVYDANCVSRLQLILKGKHLGFTLTEIDELMRRGAASDNELELDEEQLVSQLRHLEARRAEIDEAIRTLREKHKHLFARST